LLVLLLFHHAFCKFRDAPVQLVTPDPDHSKLIFRKEAISLLESITDPIAVVGVVGPLHSGKSYLTNQLLGHTSGFTLGPSVNPETRGLWMWGRPIYKTDENGQKIAIIFLDSEGLFATDSSEAYDAKIFAITALLSSQLIYNTVRNVDQSSIDYVELLARRAQLFSLQSALKQNHTDLTQIQFPPLLWVVQNFFLGTEGKTPTEWLKSYLASTNKNTGEPSALSQIFADISCHTLFFPESDTLKLRHLDKVPYEELSEEYRNEMAQLRNLIMDTTKPKMKGKTQATGPIIAALLKSLVQGANGGHFPSVPSAWDGFITMAIRSALTKATKYMSTAVTNQFKEVYPETEAQLVLDSIENDGIDVYDKLTLGVQEAKADIPTLKKEFIPVRERALEGNENKLAVMFRNEHERLLKTIRPKDLVLPMAAKEFSKLKKDVDSRISLEFQESLSKFERSKKFEPTLKKLHQDVEGEFSKIELENRNKIIEKLEEAEKKAITKFSESLRQHQQDAVPLPKLNELSKEYLTQASSVFDQESGFASLEEIAKGVKNHLAQQLAAVYEAYKKLNEDKVFDIISTGTEHLIKVLQRDLDDIKVPQSFKVLEENAKSRYDEVINDFNSKYLRYEVHEAYKYHQNLLKARYEEEWTDINQRNQKTMRQYQAALGNTRTHLAIAAGNFYLESSFRRYAIEQAKKDFMEQQIFKEEDLAADAALTIITDPQFDVLGTKTFLIKNWHIQVFVSMILGLVIAFYLKKK